MQLLGREIGGHQPLFFIAGPCVIEGRDHALRCAEQIRKVADLTGALFIYKSSFDKANRTSVDGFRGVGMEEGLRILQDVRDATGLPVITDVHEREQAAPVAEVVDVLQTPAFLARQTDFIRAVAATGLPVNIKKGQFMAPNDMERVAEKAMRAQPEPDTPIMLCERGTTFGYGNLVVDMRGLQIMADTGWPVVFDATHSVQLPSANGSSSGGERRFVPTLAAAAVATGHVAGVFMETHPDPDSAPCDGPNAWPLNRLAELTFRLMMLRAAAVEP
jgi:2-dehydro-3-deoxyphosphooctonate aldolase (KDO 8-P synthase)